MDVLGDDQVLQANLGQSPFEGIDNNDLDIQQFEDFLNNVDVNSFFPEEAVGPAAGSVGYNGPPTTAMPPYGRGGNQDMQNKGPMQHPALQHPMVHTAAAAAPPVVLQQQQQQLGSSHVPKPHTYCHTQLPDSPPDSGSEPYSPPDGNQSEASSCNAKGNMVSGMTALPQQLYSNPMSAHSSTSPQHSSHQQHPQHHHGLHGHPSPPHHPGHHLAKASGTPYGAGSYGGGEPPKLNHPPNTVVQMPHTQIPPQMIASPYSSMNPSQNPNKKRKYSESPNASVTPGLMNAMGQSIGGLVNIKQEPECMPVPGMLGECDDDYTCDIPQDPSMFLDGAYQVIKWQPYQPTKYCELLDASMKDLPPPSYRVDADKGFNFSIPDDSFVCQKKNHFQITVHVGMSGDPRYVKTDNGPKKIDNFCIHFKGVKMESTSQSIKIEQSQSDRSKKPFHPVPMDILSDQVSKVTVGRLHFSETTSNNMRKKGKPNPDQRYFLLVIGFHAHSGDENFMVAAQASERIIVRASNPGQFDSDVEVLWQKGHTQDSVFHAGRVGINTDRPDEALTIHGNLKLTGHIMQPSDQRVKKNIEEVDGKEQLKKVSQLKVYTYEYDDDFAEHVGLSEEDRLDTGVLAQELLEILPDAVRETGDIILANGQRVENFLVVNKDRLYMENVGAVKELCKLTDNLEIRIDELEKINLKLTKLKRLDSMKSTISLRSISSCSTLSLATFKKTSKEPEINNKTPVQNGSAVKSDNVEKPKPHLHHHHHHRHGSATKPEEGGICSNRFIQITITTLVLVMAFCLVSITTLYILEKQKSHNGLVSGIAFAETTPTSVKPNEAGGGVAYLTPSTTISSTSLNLTTGKPSERNLKPSTIITDSPWPKPTITSTTLARQDDGGPAVESESSKSNVTTTPGKPQVPLGRASRKPSPAHEDLSLGHEGQVYPNWPTKVTPKPQRIDIQNIIHHFPAGPVAKYDYTKKPSSHVLGTPPDYQNHIIQINPNQGKYNKHLYDVKSDSKLHKEKASHPPASKGITDKATRTDEDNQTTEDNVPPDIVTTPSPFNLPGADSSGPLMPERCRRQPSSCQVWCCPPLEPLDDPGNYKPAKSVKPENPIENSSVDTNKTFVYQVPINSHYSSKDSGQKAAQSSPPNKPQDDYPSVSVINNNPKMELTLNRILAGARARRSVDPESAPSVRPELKASLSITENNMTITTAFCEDDACRAELGGRYSYRLPIHQTFPVAFITVDFTVVPGISVSLCSNEKEQLCSSTGSDTRIHQEPLETRNPAHFDWSLPVGHYFTSTYYFRVTDTEHSKDACILPDQEINNSFAEYKLHFFRVCENGF